MRRLISMSKSYFKDPFLEILPKLDVHGETRETVIVPLKGFINENMHLGKRKIYVIHGRHGNVLKEAIHNYLKKDKRVERYYIYGMNDGITIIELKENK